MEVIETSHAGFVKDISFDHYGRRLATCSADEKPRIEVYDQDEAGNWRSLSPPWSSHEQTINKICWAHPRFGQVLGSCSDDAVVEIWEEQDSLGSAPKWHKRTSLSAPKPIKDIAFCPMHLGLKVALACMDGKVYVYEALDVMNLSDWTLEDSFDAFEQTARQTPLTNRNGPGVRCIAWNPSKFDHPMLIVGAEGDDSGTARVRVWQYPEATRKWTLLCELDPHIRPDMGCQVTDVAWAPNMGRSYHLIASSAGGGQLKVHRLNRSRDVGLVYAGPTEINASAGQAQGIWRVQWNITGSVLCSSGEEGIVRLFKSSFKGDWKEVKAVPNEGPSH